MAPTIRTAAFRTVLRRWLDSAADAAGLVLSSAGVSPPPWTPRLALERWRAGIVNASKRPPDGRHILLVAQRNRTWIEWVVFSACLLRRRGHRITILYSADDVALAYSNSRITERLGFSFWDATLSLPGLEFVDLDRFEPSAALESSYAAVARDIAPSIAAYDLGYEEHTCGADYDAAVVRAIALARTHGARSELALEQIRPDRCICPSGMIGWSSGFRAAAARRRVPSAFVEAWSVRPGHLIWGIDRTPFDVDILGWAQAVGGWDDDKERDAKAFAAFQEKATVDASGWLANYQPLQRSAQSVTLPETITTFLKRPGPVALMGTNVIGDSATLRRGSLFKNQREWLDATIAFFRARPALNLIIRAHPDEARARARVRIADFAKAAAAGCPNILVIDGAETVSTYSLIGRADVGLAWVSNFGVDMILRGKPVVIAGVAQYSKLGIGIAASSVPDYFALLEQQIIRPEPPSVAVIEQAKLYQHIIFKRMSLRASTAGYDACDFALDEVNPERAEFYDILTGHRNPFGQLVQADAATRVHDPVLKSHAG